MKRAFDFVAAATSLLVLSPLLLVVAIVVKIDSRGPVLFRQERVGRYGSIFNIHKFRTMTHSCVEGGPLITVGQDSRITRSGRWLRKYKLDELPQLFDILVGDMSFVGPRPEVPKYVAFYPAETKKLVLSVRPGMTDTASLEFFCENEILGAAADPEKTYIEEVLPRKLALYSDYVRGRSLKGDIKIIFLTIRRIATHRLS